MNCSQAEEMLGVYFDLPEGDSRRAEVEEHIRECPACAEEFHLWEESSSLIQSGALLDEMEPLPESVSSQVMARIYQDESWRIPASERTYSMPYKTRRNLFAVIALCLALFSVSFYYSLSHPPRAEQAAPAEHSALFGFHQTASYSPDDRTDVDTLSKSAVASSNSFFIEPAKLGPIREAPNYWLAVSLMGLMSTLLTMNWFARTKA
ncbi:anti-sigma factor family protein [Gorillibacterium timonense]|uniref:anti-sigma factor family protein n=1 Tax=Gorillibacterium timonense TaxID=1689269 RepID=UPI00071E0EC2|nr:zf-HC2 domain-containing protein [Gorillibacterium timonense]